MTTEPRIHDDDARLMAPLLASLDPEDWEDAAAMKSTPSSLLGGIVILH